LKTRGEGPTPRERATATVIGRNIYIFGGYNRGLEAYYNDLFIFESESLSWRKVDPRGQLPEARCGHTAATIDDKIWIFGGRVKVKKGSSLFSGSGVAYTNDLYCYDPVMNEWRRYEARGIGPSGRAMHSATAVGRKIYFFGGANSSGSRRDTSAFCDLYELDIDTMTWSECEVKGTPPTPCYGHSAVFIGNNKILFFGGKAYNVLNTLTLLDLNKMEWKQYAYAGAPLQQRWGHTATLHDTRVLLFGGRNDSGYHNTYDIIETTTQLIDIPPEELERDKQKKKLEERIKNQQIMGDLQRDVEDLKAVVNQIGEALVKQTRMTEEMAMQLRGLAEATIEIKGRVDASASSPGGLSSSNGAEIKSLVASQDEMKKSLEVLSKAHAVIASKVDALPQSSSSSSPPSSPPTKSDLSE
jgi:N-acetylneuraminic acid mutarotase